MKEVVETKYVAKDGMIFDDRIECMKYENVFNKVSRMKHEKIDIEDIMLKETIEDGYNDCYVFYPETGNDVMSICEFVRYYGIVFPFIENPTIEYLYYKPNRGKPYIINIHKGYEIKSKITMAIPLEKHINKTKKRLEKVEYYLKELCNGIHN